jgi:hypothetical protein
MIPMGCTVRRARAGDLEWLLQELARFSVFFGSKTPLFSDSQYTRDGLTRLIETQLVLMAERDEERLGFIAGVLAPHTFNPAIRVLSELFWWVTPEHRGSRAALLLLNEFVEAGKTMADWITFGVETDTLVNEHSLTKHGFRLKERCYLMEIA